MYLSLYCKSLKRVTQGFTVRGSWRPNRIAIYWPPLLWPSALCLSRSPGLLNWRPRCGFPYHILSPTSLISNSSGAPRALSAGLSLPHLISNFSGTQLIRGPKGRLRRAFSTTSYQQLLWTLTQSGALRAPSAWCGFPYHTSSPTPTVWLLVLTELYNSSTPTQSPTQSLE